VVVVVVVVIIIILVPYADDKKLSCQEHNVTLAT